MTFSIITCTYNSAAYLEKNIESVKNQTYTEYEHIFIDGFSDDGTVEIIKKYQQECPRVFFFQNPPAGISNAMNQGIQKASGEYIIHLHSDDSFYDPTVLAEVAHFLEEKKYPDWVYGQINVINEKYESVGHFPQKNIFKRRERDTLKKHLLKFYNFIPHQSVFIKKSIFEKYGYFTESLTSAMDIELWLKIKDKTEWIFMDRIISNYMIRDGSQSSGKTYTQENRKNLFTVQKKHLALPEFILARLVNFMVDIKRNNRK